jgi:hypothetical protein
MTIINLTQHKATPEQIEAGVVDLPETKREKLCKLLTFDELPTHFEICKRACAIADLLEDSARELRIPLIEGKVCAMLGGAPFFMAVLENFIRGRFVRPCYAFSKRVSIEEQMPDGTVVKKNIFKHEGFIYE